MTTEYDSITTVKQLTRNGNSICVNLTYEVGLLNVKLGDIVQITIKKRDEKED